MFLKIDARVTYWGETSSARINATSRRASCVPEDNAFYIDYNTVVEGLYYGTVREEGLPGIYIVPYARYAKDYRTVQYEEEDCRVHVAYRTVPYVCFVKVRLQYGIAIVHECAERGGHSEDHRVL
jgi:hypothetical protein